MGNTELESVWSGLGRMGAEDLPFVTGPMVPMTVLTPFSLWNLSNSFLCFAALDSPTTVFCVGLFCLELPREWGRGDTKREGWNR